MKRSIIALACALSTSAYADIGAYGISEDTETLLDIGCNIALSKAIQADAMDYMAIDTQEDVNRVASYIKADLAEIGHSVDMDDGALWYIWENCG